MKKTNSQPSKRWFSAGLLTTIFGFLILLLGAKPALFNLNRSPVVGFAQTSVFSFGLGVICLGGFLSLRASSPVNHKQSLTQDIGIRFVGTGYLISFISALADVFGLGTQSWPAAPFLGPSQAMGVILGEIIIAIGFLMFIPRRNTP